MIKANRYLVFTSIHQFSGPYLNLKHGDLENSFLEYAFSSSHSMQWLH